MIEIVDELEAQLGLIKLDLCESWMPLEQPI